MTPASAWRRCSACKNPIELGAPYWTCTVSTCNRKRTGLVFCSVTCFEVHLPIANHREAWAVEQRAPRSAAEPAAAPASAPRTAPRSEPRHGPPQEILIVASRLKEYVRARSGFNTSERVLEPLSAIVRALCDEAIRNAGRDGRRTVLDRDIPRRL